MYTYPDPRKFIENPTKGRVAFTQKVIDLFSVYVDETVNYDASIAVDVDAGMWLEDIIAEYDAVGLFCAVRDLTGEDTDDIDHAMTVLFSAATMVWEVLAYDYGTYLKELSEN